MQYLYLFIFIFFIMLNVVIGLASSRSKKRRAAEGRASAEKTTLDVPDTVPEQLKHTEARESVLKPQTADSIVESFFSVEEEKASLPGGGEQQAGETAYGAMIPGLEHTKEQIKGSGDSSEVEIEESKPMIDISEPRKEVKLSIEKNLLESEVESRVVERRKAQDEKYQVRDLYWYHNPEMDAWERINRLTPLKRAILLSEILGSPKALSEGGHSQ